MCLPPEEFPKPLPPPQDGKSWKVCCQCGTTFAIKRGEWNFTHSEVDCAPCQRIAKQRSALLDFWERLNQPFDAYRRYMATGVSEAALEEMLRFKDQDERHDLFEAMQMASFGTQPLQLTIPQRHAFTRAAMNSPVAFAW